MSRGFGALQARDEADKHYAEYLRRIDAEAVLDHYGATNINRRGNEIIHSCLIDTVEPHHANGDANPSASCNVDLKKYNCYTYGGGDIFWFIQLMEGKEHFADIVPLLGQFLTGATVENTEDFLVELEGYLSSRDSAQPAPIYSERALDRWALYHPYLKDRGISLETAQALTLGYDEASRRITIPHWSDGKLVGWQRRALSDPRWPQTIPDPNSNGRIEKYKNTTNFPKNDTVYHLDWCIERGFTELLVVESPMSVARAHTLDILNTVSTFGAKIGQGQIDRLARFDKITIWFDDDPAGKLGSLKLAEGLYRRTDVEIIRPEAGLDLADYPDTASVDEMLANADPAVLVMPEMEEWRDRWQKIKRRSTASAS